MSLIADQKKDNIGTQGIEQMFPGILREQQLIQADFP